MNSGIQLTAIYIANGFGLLLAFLLLAGLHHKNTERLAEMRYLSWMNCIAAVSCVLDPLIFTFDGRPGMAAFLLVYAGNAWMFLSTVLLGSMWVKLCLQHIYGSIPGFQKKMIRIISVLSVVMLLGNLFYPIVFGVDQQNSYFRGPLFLIYSLIEFFYILDGIVCYYKARLLKHSVKFFPVWMFVLPFCAGTLIQMLMYGVSTMWPCCEISICGVLIGLQTELVNIDQMTGLYNRNYLTVLRNELVARRMAKVTAVMIDLNGFKQINDQFGHLEGDHSLIAVGRMLSQCVSPYGEAIRYAGDEFVLILFTQNEERVQKCFDGIDRCLADYNAQDGLQYKLSFSMGYDQFNLAEQSIEDVLNEVDCRMYVNKENYYRTHPEADRRKDHNQLNENLE